MEKIEFVKRKGTNCYKWDIEGEPNDNIISMTVADMDFKSPKCVREAMLKYIEMGAMGYTRPADNYYNNFIKWEKNHYNTEIDRKWIRYSPGVVVGISWLLSEINSDSCIVLTPVYGPFLDIPNRLGIKIITSELINNNGYYTINFTDFEDKIIKNNVKVFLLCSPHNPIGRIWKKEELLKILKICEKYNVLIISDEIHHDLVLFDNQHLSILSLAKNKNNVIMLTSPAKSFNLAGIENSFMIIPNEEIRNKIDNMQDRIAIHAGNTLGHIATESAYGNGYEWKISVCNIIEKNYMIAKEILQSNLKNLIISPLEGTFLMWVDFRHYAHSENDISREIQKNCDILVESGLKYGGANYKNFVRFNLATSTELVKIAMKRIVNYFLSKSDLC